jgi:cytoskeletal protein RodZ
MTFVIRKFDYQEKLGGKLKAIRKSANLTLSEIALKTKIRKEFLKAFESGDYSSLPDPIYARNFLKKYVRALGADVNYFLEQFDNERGYCDVSARSRLPRARARSRQFLVASRFVQILVLVFLAVSVLGYMGYEIRAMTAPPQLNIFSPTDGFSTHDATIVVSGISEKDASVKINGVVVLLSKDGLFETEIALERGLNVITVQSAKRYSKTAYEYRRVIFEKE